MIKHSYTPKDLRIVVFVTPIANIGAGLTWSGLPLLLSNASGDPGNIFTLFIASAIAGLVFTLVGGSIADAMNRKTVTIVALGFDFIMTLTLGHFGMSKGIWLFYAVGFVNSVIGAMSGAALSIWVKDIISANGGDLATGMAKRGLASSIAKTLGFAAGPLVYSALQFNALFVDAAFSLIPGIAIMFLNDLRNFANKESPPLAGYFEIFSSKFWNRQRALILGLFAITATFTVPTVMIAYGTLINTLGGSKVEASAFWLFASLGSMCSNFLLTRPTASNLDSMTKLLVPPILMTVAFLGLWLSSNSFWFIGSYVFFTLANPVLSNALGVEVYQKCQVEFRGRFGALCSFVDDAIGLAVLIICQRFVSPSNGQTPFMLALPLLALTLLVILKCRTWLVESPGENGVPA